MKLAELLQRTLGLFAAAVLFLMMTITAVDVTGRYFFNNPQAGGFEITEI
jgi:TRAP-type C4-dicarboxylate transport system permease small subunit